MEVLDDRTDASQTFANPDGTFSYQTFAEPKWVMRKGSWQELDASLRQTPDGDWAPALSESPLVLSGGGSGPLATLTVDGKQMTLTWPSALPEPTASGATLTYPDVLSGVDLQVTATSAGGAEETLVVKDATAASGPALQDLVQTVDTGKGATAATDAGGNLTVTDAQGDVLVNSPAPVMWDSATATDAAPASDSASPSHDATADGAHAADAGRVAVGPLPSGTRSTSQGPGSRAHQGLVKASLRNHTLRLVADKSLLAAASTVFPVYIDPSYTPHPSSGAALNYDEVQQAYPTTSNWDTAPSSGNATGYQGFSSPTGIERTYYNLSVPSAISGATVLSATLNTKVSYAAAAGSTTTTVDVWSMCTISTATTWNNQPCKDKSVNPNYPDPAVAKSFTTTSQSPNLAVAFNVTPSMQMLADKSANNWTIGLFNATETDDSHFVRFATNPTFSITYDHAPATPTGEAVTPVAVTGGVTHTASPTPTFSAGATDADSDTVKLAFQVLSGSTVVASGTSAFVDSGATGTFTPSSTLAPGTYTWQVRATDGAYYGAWSAAQSLTVDDTTPAVPMDLQAAGTDSGTPLLSGVVYDQSGDDVTGNIYLTDSSGNAVIATPTATGTVPSGQRVTYQLPAGSLTVGATYHWYMTACDGSLCSASTATRTFTVTDPPADTTAATPANAVTTTLSASALGLEDGISDTTGCGGTACGVNTGVTGPAVGGDGTDHWVSALKPDLSGIPAGSTIYSATLQLTKTGCTGDCTADTMNLDLAQSDPAAQNTGALLAADLDTQSDTVYTGTEATAAVDLTGVVSQWLNGGVPDNGLVLEAQDQATATSGVTFSAPTLTIVYTVPTVPGAPTGLSAAAGDGGVLLTWVPPANPGYQDTTGSSITGYTLTATDSAGAAVATATATGQKGVLTGLTNGTAYTFSVAATNSVGTGTPATTSAAPAAVPGGPTRYIQGVNQYLNAQDQMEETQNLATTAVSHVQAQSSSDAEPMTMSSAQVAAQVDTAYSASASFANLLTADSANAQNTAALENANSMTDNQDATALSNSLAMPSSDGQSVTVFTFADETFTTVDTSTGTSVSTPGEDSADDEFFLTAGTTPYLTGRIDADQALDPVTDGTNITATAGNVDQSATDTSAYWDLSANGQFTLNPSYTDPGGGGGYGNSYVSAWALKHVHSSNQFGDDCTDFVSKSMAYGGDFSEIYTKAGFRGTRTNTSNDHYWFLYYNTVGGHYAWSHTWTVAHDNYLFEKAQGAFFVPSKSEYAPGDIVWVNWKGGSSAGISHAAIITKVVGSHIYVTQHSNNRTEPIYKVAGVTQYWTAQHPHLRIWVAEPWVK
ncbi:DNRLRE domain-containing protein [Streptomyces griseorubiginosus]|uniref:DNRLRE domain-containing protein n=1 Tax=Streptomyces griseorubiginosus TaxID=67304 RepID=UPI002E811F58|nr:DNRLRE domain-containing protein [Streptomyces griseorubiginosus]WUB45276.1 DNRLRE domain-containing protein [Streptomyces griseorubiginosus]WUB53793.1 DNRLRE domain-containing protein [Streptomyces griseorubiginosus]